MSDTFVIITRAGRARQFTDKDYWSILRGIYSELQSAGGNHDNPNMLIYNGKVVIDKGLHSIAWAYGDSLTKARQRAEEQAREQLKPEWL